MLCIFGSVGNSPWCMWKFLPLYQIKQSNNLLSQTVNLLFPIEVIKTEKIAIYIDYGDVWF